MKLKDKNFCEYQQDLLNKGEFQTFECLLCDNGLTLSEYIKKVADSVLPPPDLNCYFEALRKFTTTGEME